MEIDKTSSGKSNPMVTDINISKTYALEKNT
jgi:hypothetical protein